MTDPVWRRFSNFQTHALLVRLWREGHTGLFQVRLGSHCHQLWWSQGQVQSGDSDDPQHSLGLVLVALGSLSPQQWSQICLSLKEGDCVETQLMDLGLATASELARAHEAMAHRVFELFCNVAHGVFRFWPGRLKAQPGPPKISMPHCLLDALLAFDQKSWLSGQFPPDLHFFCRPAAAVPEPAQVPAKMAGLLRQINGERTFRQLSFDSGLDDFSLLKMLYAFKLLDWIALDVPPEAESMESVPKVPQSANPASPVLNAEPPPPPRRQNRSAATSGQANVLPQKVAPPKSAVRWRLWAVALLSTLVLALVFTWHRGILFPPQAVTATASAADSGDHRNGAATADPLSSNAAPAVSAELDGMETPGVETAAVEHHSGLPAPETGIAGDLEQPPGQIVPGQTTAPREALLASGNPDGEPVSQVPPDTDSILEDSSAGGVSIPVAAPSRDAGSRRRDGLPSRQAALELLAKGRARDLAAAWREAFSTGDPGYTLGIYMVCDPEHIAFTYRVTAEPLQVFILPKTFRGRACYWVCAGQYSSRREALLAIPKLPAGLREQAATVDAYAISGLLR